MKACQYMCISACYICTCACKGMHARISKGGHYKEILFGKLTDVQIAQKTEQA